MKHLETVKTGDLVALERSFSRTEEKLVGIVLCVYGPTGKFSEPWATVLWSYAHGTLEKRKDAEEIWCKNLNIISKKGTAE